MIAGDAIYTAIREVLEGSLGNVRLVPMQLFGYGVFRGIPDEAAQALVQDPSYSHRFDVTISRTRSHSASPLSVKSSHRMVTAEIEISIWTRLASTVEETERDAQRYAAAWAAEVAIQALMYPGNLTATVGGRATGIVSGMLLGDSASSSAPRWEVADENWNTQILRSRITATAIVSIPQPTE